uniref:Calnexin n=1 Tax=Bursaphelenchus xylophilus TaxID=6326 RepID=A0A1I7STR1_BURXY
MKSILKLGIFVSLISISRGNEEEAKFEPGTFEIPQLKSEKVHFVEVFEEVDGFNTIWKKSQAKKEGADESLAKYDGIWEVASPSKIVLEGDLGLIVRSKARHHAIAAILQKPVKFEDDVIVIQYEVKYEEGQECGGGYVKLLSEGAEKDISSFTDRTDYTIMFGPDKCGPQSKIHFILKVANPINGTVSEHHAPQPKNIPDVTDKKTHLFTLKLRKNNDYEVLLDGNSLYYGSMMRDLQPPVQPPEEIADPDDKKPEDWDEREFINDPEAKKPDDWDEAAPKEIVDENAVKPSDWLQDEQPLVPDPTAQKPEDWDDEMDGEYEPKLLANPKCEGVSGCGKWEKPIIPNPAYKGPWSPPKIANPNFKGKWFPRIIKNPNYFEANPYQQLKTITALGFELWTIDKNIIFDNILITSDEALAAEFAAATFEVKKKYEETLERFESPNVGFFQNLVDATNEKPYLWAVYILVVLIPVIALSAYFFGHKSQPTYTETKKDEPEDAEPEEGELEDDVEEEGEIQKGEAEKEASKSPKPRKRVVRKVDE